MPHISWVYLRWLLASKCTRNGGKSISGWTSPAMAFVPSKVSPSKQELTPSPCSEWRDHSLLLSTSAKGDGYFEPMKVKGRIKFYWTRKKHQIHPVCSASWSYCGHPFLTMLNVFTAAIPTLEQEGLLVEGWADCYSALFFLLFKNV